MWNQTESAPPGGVLSDLSLPSGPGSAGGWAAQGAVGALSATLGPVLAGVWKRLREHGAEWRRLAAQRRQLARLDERMLKDIGLTRVDAHQEARKWFWQP